MSELDDYQAAVDAEYGTYVAVEPIEIGGARAFNVGDPVPKSTVERDDSPIGAEQVAKRQTKAGQKATATATPEEK